MPRVYGAMRGAMGSSDMVETALCRALEAAASAGRFDVVAQLAKELEARRLASAPNVERLDDARARRPRKQDS